MLTSFSLAATYYVRTDGNDSNSGTTDSSGGAWLTLAKANATAQPGDTIIVGVGEFYVSSTLTTPRSGTVGNPIIWQGVNNTDTVIRRQEDVWPPYVWFVNQDYVQFKQLRFYRSSLKILAGGDNGLIDDCYFHQDQWAHIYFDGGSGGDMYGWTVENSDFREASDTISREPCIRLAGSNHIIQDNYFTSTVGGTDIFHYLGIGTIIRRNTFENWGVRAGSTNHVDWIQTFTTHPSNVAEDLLVEGNFCRNMNGVQLGNVTDQMLTGRVRNWTFRNNITHRLSNAINLYAPGFKFYNNTFSYFYGSGDLLLFKDSTDRGTVTSVDVYNNIFYKGGTNPASSFQGWFSNEALATGIVANNNLVIGTGAGTVKGSRWTQWGNASSVNGLDPLFVGTDAINAGNAATPVTPDDFRLEPDSPAIGVGANLSATFTTDYTGASRGLPFDIGAFEYDIGGLPTDTIPPVVVSAVIDSTGSNLTITFSENVLSVSEAHYTLSGGNALSSVNINGPTVTMNLSPLAISGETVTLSYTSGIGRTSDIAGNLLATFSGEPVINYSLETSPDPPRASGRGSSARRIKIR